MQRQPPAFGVANGEDEHSENALAQQASDYTRLPARPVEAVNSALASPRHPVC